MPSTTISKMRRDVVVLWGLPNDGPLERVYRHLQLRNVPTLLIDQQDVLNCSFVLSIDSEVTGTIHTPHFSLETDNVRAIYVRPYDIRQSGILEDCDPAGDEWKRASYFEDTMFLWSEIANACVINPPSKSASNNSKPYQMELIRRCGLRVPETILTTDPQRVREYRRSREKIIYKSISCQRSIVAELRADDDQRIDDVRWCPTQFQEYIEGIDYRIHVLGNNIFASKINSSSADYRYADDTHIESVTLADDIREKCFLLTKNLGLHFSGIDLRQSSDGEWCCFEVNPSPGYTYFEDSDEQPISNALAEYFAQSLCW